MLRAIDLSTIYEASESRLSLLEETMQKCFEKKCECEKFQKVMAEYEHRERKELKKRSPTTDKASLVSFMEDEMQIISDQGCTCDQFESMIKEYTNLLKSFNPLKCAEQKLVNALRTIENFRNENEKLKYEVLEKERKISNFVEEIDDLKKNLYDAEVTNEILKQQNSDLIESLAALREANAKPFCEERNDEKIVNGQISSDDSGNDENRDQSDGEEDIACSVNELQDEEHDNNSSDPSSSDESAAGDIKFCKKCEKTKSSRRWVYHEQRELNNEKCKKCQTELSNPWYNFVTGDNKSGKQCRACYMKQRDYFDGKYVPKKKK
uniref:Uncharacterized protein n=1 Tax=Panagrolaimus davidi TaxID=227884 RepID=A0A914PIH6_9BILA